MLQKQIPPSLIGGKTYFADEEGNIINRKGHRLKDHSVPRDHVPSSHGGDYPNVNIAGKNRYISHLVCATFWGLPPADHVCHHLDGNKFNNRPSNLMWVHRDLHPAFDRTMRAGIILQHVDLEKQLEEELSNPIQFHLLND